MIIRDYTIPEAEVIYQKAVIRGAWWFFGFMLLCIFVYFVVRKIVEDRKDARAHQRKLARIKENTIIGQAGFDQAKSSQSSVIIAQKRTIDALEVEIDRRDEHISRLEKTMKELHFGDVADRIRQEMEQQTN